MEPRPRLQSIEINLDQEKRETEPTKVARMFLFQSIDSREIGRDKPEEMSEQDYIASVSLTRLILIKKAGNAENPGQLMPIGGRVNPGENTQRAAERECVEETHLRPTPRTVRPLGQQRYSFLHKRRGEVLNEADYFKGNLSSPGLDIPFPLDPEEDKIEDFVYLSLDETYELFSGSGKIIRNGQELYVQDALSPDRAQREKNGVSVDESERFVVVDRLIDYHRFTDAVRKMNVLRFFKDVPLEDLSSMAREKLANQELINRIEDDAITCLEALTSLPDEPSHSEFEAAITLSECIWQENVVGLALKDIKLALMRSQFSGDMVASLPYSRHPNSGSVDRLYSEKTGIGVPTASLLFPLIASRNLREGDKTDIKKVHALMRMPTGEKFIKMLISEKKYRRLIRKEKRSYNEEEFLNILENEGLLERSFSQTYEEISREHDLFFERLRDEAGLAADEGPVDQLDELKGVNLSTLIRYATAKMTILKIEPSIRPEIRANEDSLRVLQWEACRKLVLLLLLNDAHNIRGAYEEAGIGPVEKIETDISGSLKKFGNCRRVFRHGDSQMKGVRSLLRKIIVRDEALGEAPGETRVGRDIFAEAYVFDGTDSRFLEEKEWAPPKDGRDRPYAIYSGKDNPVRLDKIVAPAVIFELMTNILKKGNGRIEILEYKPLPRPGENFQSEGSGGGGDVRFAKFYIKHTDGSGTVRYREVQVFVPDLETGRSGSQELERKKEDDRDYGVKRLFHTKKETRAFMERLFPSSIYSHTDIRKMYHKRAV